MRSRPYVPDIHQKPVSLFFFHRNTSITKTVMAEPKNIPITTASNQHAIEQFSDNIATPYLMRRGQLPVN
jgi:hypothetical protein